MPSYVSLPFSGSLEMLFYITVIIIIDQKLVVGGAVLRFLYTFQDYVCCNSYFKMKDVCFVISFHTLGHVYVDKTYLHQLWCNVYSPGQTKGFVP